VAIALANKMARVARVAQIFTPATLSFYATKDGKISISFSGWDSNKVALESVSEATDCASGLKQPCCSNADIKYFLLRKTSAEYLLLVTTVLRSHALWITPIDDGSS
jgi:hypothetical protein